jgi:C_GCAxxG_C_C family probable redox protein
MMGEKPKLEQRWVPERTGEYGVVPIVPGTRDKVLDAVAQAAFTNLEAYGNCCRATLWAIQTHLRREDAVTLRASAVMAGGICGTGETCGVVLGGLLAIGQALGNDDFRDVETYKHANVAARGFVDRIQERYGSTRCHDLQVAMMGWRPDEPGQVATWFEEGGLTACAGLCAEAARFAAEIILDRESAV